MMLIVILQLKPIERRVLLDKFHVVKVYTKYPYPSDNPIEGRWEFESARDVAFFMFGRWPDKYIIYKNGKYCPFVYQHQIVEDLEKYLSGDVQFPAIK
jgi:hypothetical protein